jgi:septum formation protein
MLLLASSSTIRLTLLRNARVPVTSHPARIDEFAIRQSLQTDHTSPRDIADTLAEMKARKIAQLHPTALVLGCDQILALKDQVFERPTTPEQARDQLTRLRGQTHQLYSGLVLYHNAEPIWRHIGTAKLTMHSFSDAYLDGYISRQWPTISRSVGAYQLESEGIRLFSAIEGDYFTILGLPLLPLLSYLSLRGFITS